MRSVDVFIDRIVELDGECGLALFDDEKRKNLTQNMIRLALRGRPAPLFADWSAVFTEFSLIDVADNSAARVSDM